MRSDINPTDLTASAASSGPPDKPHLLFIAPTYPDTQGNGLAMRAGMFIEALSAAYRVSLLVVPLFGRQTATSLELVRRCCEQVFKAAVEMEAGFLYRLRDRLDGRPELLRLLARSAEACVSAVSGQSFDVVHAFRLYAAPLAIQVAASMSPRPALHLDVDDIESSTHRSLAELYELNGHPERAELERAEAAGYAAAERRLLPRFERVYVCTEIDAGIVRRHTRAEVRVAPNTVRAPEEPLQPQTTHPFTFLFVGTLGYYPNEDAVAFFCREVLPKLRSAAESPFLLRIAGSGPPDGLRPLARLPEVRFAGYVPDIGGLYAEADAVLVPLRAGGGTRIKVLEAFAYRRPVVSTSTGIEGIDAIAGQHFLLGDTAGELATHCLRLMRDRDLGKELAERAYELVTTQYAPERLRQAVTAP